MGECPTKLSPHKLIFVAFCGLVALLVKNQQDYTKAVNLVSGLAGIVNKPIGYDDAIRVGKRIDPHIAAACQLEPPKVMNVESEKPKSLRPKN